MITIRDICYFRFCKTARRVRLVEWLLVRWWIFILCILCIFNYYLAWTNIGAFLILNRLIIIRVWRKRLRRAVYGLVKNFFTLGHRFPGRDNLRLFRSSDWLWFWNLFWHLFRHCNWFFRSFLSWLISGEYLVDQFDPIVHKFVVAKGKNPSIFFIGPFVLDLQCWYFALNGIAGEVLHFVLHDVLSGYFVFEF